MILYGIHPVRQALETTPAKIQRIVVARGKSSARLQEIIDQARSLRVPVQFEPLPALDRKSGRARHQNVLAEMTPTSLMSLEEILTTNPTRLLIADGVEDPRNLGALLRTAEAAGVEGVLLPARHSAGITPVVVQSSAGAALNLKAGRMSNTVRTLEQLKEAGFWSVGLDMRGSENAGPLDRSLQWVIVVGGESRGLRPLVRRHCDFLLRLPMLGKVESLNLSVAAGILMYRLLPESE